MPGANVTLSNGQPGRIVATGVAVRRRKGWGGGFGTVTRRPFIHRGLPATAGLMGGPGAGEQHSVDVATGFSGFALAGVVGGPFNGISVGSEMYQRVGRKIKMQSILIKGFIAPSSANLAAVPAQMGRWMLVYDRQPAGALPAPGDILLLRNNVGAAITDSTCGMNLDNRERFAVLVDKTFHLPAIGVNGATPASAVTLSLYNIQPIKIFKKLKGLETVYSASTGLIGDIRTGSLISLAIGSGDGNATPAWGINFGTRVRFTD